MKKIIIKTAYKIPQLSTVASKLDPDKDRHSDLDPKFKPYDTLDGIPEKNYFEKMLAHKKLPRMQTIYSCEYNIKSIHSTFEFIFSSSHFCFVFNFFLHCHFS